MEIFWNTIAAYNAATWPAQIVFTGIATLLLLLLCLRPTNTVGIAMKSFMAMLNFWIAGVYYMIYCRPREYHGMLALFWAIMGGIWIYDLLVKHASLERTGQHNAFAVLLLAMPLIYPLCSLALGHVFPMMTSPVMPCSVAVFTIGLMLAFSEQVNIVLAMFLCHWALILRHTRRLPAGVQYRTCTLHLLSGVCPKQRRPADETLGPRTRCTAHCAESGRRHLLYRHAPAPTRPIHPNHLIYTRMLKQIFYHCNGLEPINRHITRYYLYSPFLDLPVLLTKEMRLSGCIERLFRNNCVKFDTTIGFIKVKQ